MLLVEMRHTKCFSNHGICKTKAQFWLERERERERESFKGMDKIRVGMRELQAEYKTKQN
jgi:hypothetical protein